MRTKDKPSPSKAPVAMSKGACPIHKDSNQPKPVYRSKPEAMRLVIVHAVSAISLDSSNETDRFLAVEPYHPFDGGNRLGAEVNFATSS